MKILGAKSRDNSRTPMQWDGSAFAGFSITEPWIPVCSRYPEINTQDRDEEDSIFRYYRELVKLRKELPVIQDGTVIPLLREDDRILAYERKLGDQELYVFCNFFEEESAGPFEVP